MTPVWKLFDDVCFGHKRRGERLDVLFEGVAALDPSTSAKEATLE